MIYRLFFSSILILLFLTSSFSQEFSEVGNPDNLIKEITTRTSEVNSIRGRFVQSKHVTSLGMKIQSKGFFFYKKAGDKIRWEYKEPSNFTVIFSNSSFRVVNNGEPLSNTNKQDEVFTELNKVVINSLNGNISETEGFMITLLESTELINFKLIPYSNNKINSLLKSIEIYLDKEDLRISAINLIEKNNDVTSINLFIEQTNVSVPDSLFN